VSWRSYAFFVTSHCYSSGLHNPSSSVQSRVFYLFSRFIKEVRYDIGPDLALTILEGIRDLLVPKVEIPELEDPEEKDLLTEAVEQQGGYQAQLYLLETAGVLVSMFFKDPDQSARLLLSVVKPLLDQLEAALQTPINGPQDVLPILTTHHIIMALGNIAKGFPDYPSPVPDGYILPPLEVFQQMAQAILVSLNVMNIHKVVRDAVRTEFFRRIEQLLSTLW
jgi:exportin-T